MRLGHRIDNRLIDVAVRRALSAGHLIRKRCNRRLGQRPIARLDRIQPPGNLDHRRAFAVVRKMLAEALRIQRGRSHDHFQIRPPGQQLLQVTQHEVDVQTALVRLIDDEGVVLAQQRVGLCLGQQNAVGHQLDVSLGRDAVGKAYLEADIPPQLGLQLLRNARRRGACGNAARLGVADQPRQATAEFETDFGQLRGLARAGFATDDDHLMLKNGSSDFFPSQGNWQRLVIDDCRPCSAARLGVEPHCTCLIALIFVWSKSPSPSSTKNRTNGLRPHPLPSHIRRVESAPQLLPKTWKTSSEHPAHP